MGRWVSEFDEWGFIDWHVVTKDEPHPRWLCEPHSLTSEYLRVMWLSTQRPSLQSSTHLHSKPGKCLSSWPWVMHAPSLPAWDPFPPFYYQGEEGKKMEKDRQNKGWSKEASMSITRSLCMANCVINRRCGQSLLDQKQMSKVKKY